MWNRVYRYYLSIYRSITINRPAHRKDSAVPLVRAFFLTHALNKNIPHYSHFTIIFNNFNKNDHPQEVEMRKGIGKQLMLGFILIALIAGIVGIIGYMGMHKLEAGQKEFATVRLPSIESIQTINEAQASIAVGERGMLINQMFIDPEVRKKQYSSGAFVRYADAKKIFDSLPHNEFEKAKWNNFLQLWDNWMKAHDEMVSISKKKGEMLDAGAGIYDPSIIAVDDQLFTLMMKSRKPYITSRDSIISLAELNKTMVKESAERSEEMARNYTILLILVVIAGMLAAVMLGAIITRSITKPIQESVEFAGRIADGDLTVTINLTRNDEIGELKNALNITAERLNKVVSAIKLSAEQLAAVSREINSTSQMMSQTTAEQASETEEISSTIEEMVSNIIHNSDNATETEKISLKAANGIINVKNSSIKSLNSVKEINQKISIIEEIAFRSNLLALNAAVEAARSGEDGKGFAVVALEVRRLSERSRVAAEEINKISSNSVKVSEEAERLLDSIIPDIEKTSKLLQEISQASQEQNIGTGQVTTAISQINSTTQQNAAIAEELATSSEELAAQAEMLMEMVAFFKVDKE